ncbi:MAG: hypothetical protein AAFP81_19845 [Pseudomonadota bacterium]
MKVTIIDAKYRQSITYFGERTVVWCDGKCEKAWGINGRKYHEDHTPYTDEEMGSDAPDDPGTYEGRDAKPTAYANPDHHRLNKWCVRECERSDMPSYEEAKVL